MKKRISIIAALALVSIALVAPASQAAANRYITVKARGTVQVTPDAVRISATATNIAATSKEALAATSKSSASIRAALKSSKIDNKDIATQSISVIPEYRYSNDGGSTLVAIAHLKVLQSQSAQQQLLELSLMPSLQLLEIAHKSTVSRHSS